MVDPLETTDGLPQPDSDKSEPIPTIEADVAREKTRQALFGEAQAQPRVHRFTLLEAVGSGGMGTVYAAYDPQLDRKVAVKLVRGKPGVDSSEGDRKRMVAEARAMAKVAHPNVVAVYEVGTHEPSDGGSPSVFVAMEFVSGKTLRQWVDEDKPPWHDVVDAYAAAGRGLAAVHRAGLVHRDFKPDNAMIDEDRRVRVMDFGLARQSGPTEPSALTASGAIAMIAELTRTGALVGTPAYMSPEQFEGGSADQRSDQYAFCVAMYEAIWGERPYTAGTPAELVAKVLQATDAPEPPRTIVPGRIRAAIRRGLRLRPEDRWPSMDALLLSLSPRRARRRAGAWIGAGLSALAFAWAVAGTPTEAPCGRGDAAFGSAWDEQRAVAVGAAFEATQADFAAAAFESVRRSLTNYREGWIEEYRRACEASRVDGTQSEALLDRRTHCLDRRRREVDALAGAFERADAQVVENAVSAVGNLVSPQRCGDRTYLEGSAEPPTDAEVASGVHEISDRLAQARALRDTSGAAAALAVLRELLPLAREVGYGPTLAEVEVLAGEIEATAGKPEVGIELLRHGYFAARRAGVPSVAATAATRMATWTISQTADTAEARLWLELARSEVAAADLTDAAGKIAYAEATLLKREGDLEGALMVLDEQVRDQAGRYGADDEGLIMMYAELSGAYASVGRYAPAIEYAEKGVDLCDRVHGPTHPAVSSALFRLGDALTSARRFAESIAPLERAFDIRRTTLEPGHPNIAAVAAVLGSAYVSTDRVEDGLQLLRDAADTARESSDAWYTGAMLNPLAQAYQQVGRLEDAEATYAEALEHMKRAMPNGHPGIAVVLANLGSVAADRGDHEAALERMTEALAMRQALAGRDNAKNSALHLQIGRQLLALERRREAADALREATRLTASGPIDQLGVRVRLKLSEALPNGDPEARAALDDARTRCAALDALPREAARCDKIPD